MLILVFCGSRSKNGFRIWLITHELNLAHTQASLVLLAFGYLFSEKGTNELNGRFKKGEIPLSHSFIFQNLLTTILN